ncbi:unnamed protein product [Mytilus edulis]|uniref:Uncharacterized protein n=1 Tax=Mytilus edulis TaxID=6550 RepID=A0A8S3TPQ3_MYTED|nr:unnamed protein product [Mytilus edulis]
MKKWITPGTWKVTEERRHMNKKIHDTKSERLQERHKASYRVLDKQIKRMNRADKRAYMEDLAKQAEEAADKEAIMMSQIKDKHGRLLATEDDQKAKCAEHFKEVRNRPAIDKEAIIIEALQDLEINTNLPERQEIIIAIKALKNGKSPGQDNLNEELFKVDPELAAEILQSLFTSIWEGKIIPDDWTKGIIIKLAKKGALSDCNNWRDIKVTCTVDTFESFIDIKVTCTVDTFESFIDIKVTCTVDTFESFIDIKVTCAVDTFESFIDIKVTCTVDTFESFIDIKVTCTVDTFESFIDIKVTCTVDTFESFIDVLLTHLNHL